MPVCGHSGYVVAEHGAEAEAGDGHGVQRRSPALAESAAELVGKVC